MDQIIDGCKYIRCPLRKKCYRFTLKRRLGQGYFRYWHGCAHFWDKKHGPKKQVSTIKNNNFVPKASIGVFFFWLWLLIMFGFLAYLYIEGIKNV